MSHQKYLIKLQMTGLGGQTDEEKMGVKYSQIAEMIETGNTDSLAKEKILKMYKASKHKREKIPTYTFERDNFLLKY